MNDDIAIKVDNLIKVFKEQNSSKTFKQFFVGLAKKSSNHKDPRFAKGEFRAVNNMSFEVKKGEFLGIVGKNGGGKSTLLKLLAGVYTPTSGNIQINGKLTPFIELGVGFSPELSGHDNVYLNGALLGFSRKQMDEMYDDIVSFAELEDFMDVKLKNYSSGMQVRLAFSVAIRAESDILLIDEILAVGDEAFQRKCHDYFEKLKHKKKTVILVTHAMSAVERFCNRAILIDEGKIVSDGKAHKIASRYSELNDESYDKAINEEDENKDKEQEKPTYKKSGIKIRIMKTDESSSKSFISGERALVRLQWEHEGVKNVGVAIFKQDGEYIYGTNTIIDKVKLNNKKAIDYIVHLPLAEGRYFLKVGLFGNTDSEHIDFEERGSSFTIHRNKQRGRWGGMVDLDSLWQATETSIKHSKRS